MAPLSLGHSSSSSSSLLTNQNISSIRGFKSSNLVRCQRGETMVRCSRKEKKELKQEKHFIKAREIYNSADLFLKGLKDSLSPKQKGDWKDVVLMSFAFAVYVYISQQLVCAYCAWNSMLNHPF